jgi:probable rRNA maturation factor
MSISFLTEGLIKPKLKYKIIVLWLNEVVKHFSFRPGSLTYIFCKDEYLKEINIKFLNHDYFTDIITFDYSENMILSGDMFISVDRVNENSILFDVTFEDEMLRVIVHGLLHLIGFKDASDNDKNIIRELENECIFMYREIANEYIK